MGLFDFVKDAGKKLFGDDEEKAVAANRDQVAKMETAKRQAVQRKFQNELTTHGLTVDNLQVDLQGEGVVRLRGKVPNQETREKVVLAVGNVTGIRSVDDDLEVLAGAAAAEAATFYTVKSGDTLSKIAKQVYGDASLYPQIFEANKPMLDSPDKIYPGQNLRVPALATTGVRA
jgi:nucleoid-associated protein YgaU